MVLDFNADGSIKLPKKGSKKFIVSEKLDKVEDVVVMKEGENSTYPIVAMKCGKCNFDKAYFWTTQTRAADESETKFYKCKKCTHTWRVYR